MLEQQNSIHLQVDQYQHLVQQLRSELNQHKLLSQSQEHHSLKQFQQSGGSEQDELEKQDGGYQEQEEEDLVVEQEYQEVFDGEFEEG